MDKSLEAIYIMDLLTIRENDRGIEWLKRTLQWAVELEFATIPLWCLVDRPRTFGQMRGM
jgi:hypothetical protein